MRWSAEPRWHRYLDAHELCDFCEAVGRSEVARFIEHRLSLEEGEPGYLVHLNLRDMEQDFQERLDAHMDQGYESDAPYAIRWLRLEFGDIVAILKGW